MEKKVIFLIGTLSNGGAERVVSNITLNLSEEIEREIVLFGKEAKVDYDYKGKILYLDRAELNSGFTKVKTFLKRIIELRRIKKRNPEAKVISFLEYPNLLNILSGNRRNTILSVRNYMSKKHHKGMKSFFWNWSIKRLYKKAAKIIVVSQEMKKDLVEKYLIPVEKIKLIYNSYPLEKINEHCKENIEENFQHIFSKPVIISAGRLGKQKGQEHLIRAFHKAKIHHPELKLVILGDGEKKAYLQGLANNLEIQNDVHFLGFQFNPFKYIANSKMFVMTSYYEGFPNALSEAMACKVPVISTDCPSGPKEILAPNETQEIIDYNHINSRYGMLVPNVTNQNRSMVETMIANGIDQILSDQEFSTKLSNLAYERISEFDISVIIKEWEDLILE